MVLISLRTEEETNRAIEEYSDLVHRICMVHLKNHADTEDIFQKVFLKYVLTSVVFKSKEHEKAWFIRVTINACKDLLKNFFRKHVTVSLDEIVEQSMEMKEQFLLEMVLNLPPKYKDIVYLYYYEEYTAPEIANILNKNVNTVYTLLNRAKILMRKRLEREGYG